MTPDFIAAELENCFSDSDLFEQVDELNGEVYRQIDDRRTFRVLLENRPYFVKVHHGVGWREIFKNLMQGRAPVLGAKNEWLAIERLHAWGVPTMTASLYCERGVNPSARRSAIMTESLEPTISLEDYKADDAVQKRKILEEVARISGLMHRAGVNHRDFYLCHFLMRTDKTTVIELHVIDLHRAQVRDRVPRRWQVKDLGGLLFSAFDKKLTRRDLLRFIKVYSKQDLRDALSDKSLWRQVVKRAKKLYLQDHDKLPDEITELLTNIGDES
ncbi:MAG: lipopolysaccharide core heptose(I) kinase RfaP [Pseudomonadales bacterium]|nr:lipopolysaccharide core heptose(I) kinase RfaP [Pseudomonadales bacterium]MBO6563732.1 lipopolysaccharide core heptose(I) kinase RfaP [Pseudomonadales bacterium]MBO6597360.1 lipopolysaccharide core heptose(I) kinase RfaP [Pseudomonadales bacterium]MBO6824094.1 lipopolysaccharide core heptose(I) kinase RfaP [Pseudomonadales bacterium]